jgi:hypothetical protein
MQMKLRKSILFLLLLAAIGLFVSGCFGGECPFRKIFGNKSADNKQPCPCDKTPEPPADANTK